ncbi:MAG: SRPBCC family protein, partial [Actinomycetota bacterium]|nr:SRPBCC family protein [Actinomycetota bacterium]
MASTIHKNIEVDVDVSTAYNQWTQFEDFPLFMKNIEEVRQVDDTTLHWKGDIAGVERKWTAKITDQHPDQRIAWRAEGEVTHAGVVTFERLAANRTGIYLAFEYEPDDWREKAADALNITERRVEGDLERFKEFIEERGGRETGDWRGDIDQEHRT